MKRYIVVPKKDEITGGQIFFIKEAYLIRKFWPWKRDKIKYQYVGESLSGGFMIPYKFKSKKAARKYIKKLEDAEFTKP